MVRCVLRDEMNVSLQRDLAYPIGGLSKVMVFFLWFGLVFSVKGLGVLW